MSERTTAILCAGELLVDLISVEFAETLDQVSTFKRIPGGSPANLCMNMARLGNKTRLVSTVGQDDMGVLLKKYVADLGVDVSGILQIEEPTTLILVTRSAETSNFEAYRMADPMISIRQFPYQQFSDISIFHTTCFALSKKPAQSTILEAAENAKRAKCRMSIDVNYAEKIWPDTKDARRIIADFVRLGAMVKVSEVDWSRLYGEMVSTDAVLDHFLMLGAKEVCLTLGGEGCWIASESERHFLPARPIEVKDTTGAGDAFWAGYLTARLDEKTLLESVTAGRRMAELKLAHFGPLPKTVNRSEIYADLDV
jgi:sugar/nucleoside kinase (ribokinase family)